MAFLQTDIDLAFSQLRLAVAEWRLENRARAVSLIEKAVLSYKAVKKQLDDLPDEFGKRDVNCGSTPEDCLRPSSLLKDSCIFYPGERRFAARTGMPLHAPQILAKSVVVA